MDGVIAASAPIWSFVGLDPPYDFNAFDETVTADANVTLTGISLTSSIGSVEQNSIYSVTGISMTMSLGEETTQSNARVIPTGIQLQTSTGDPNITSWEEINPGVSNVWTEVDLAA